MLAPLCAQETPLKKRRCGAQRSSTLAARKPQHYIVPAEAGRHPWSIRFVPKAALQADLFESAPELPQGMRYGEEILASQEERDLLARLPTLPFRAFEFQGFLGKRRTVSFGWRYDFNGGGLGET